MGADAGAVEALRWDQWSTTVEVVTRGLDLAGVVGAVRSELAAVDAACNRFRSDSELSRVNRRNTEGPTWISPVFQHYLQAGLDMAEATDGLVDPTVGASLRRLGYDADIEEVRRGPKDVGPTVVVRQRANFRDVGLEQRDDEPGAWLHLPPGVELDLGATAKALAADRCATAAFEVSRSPVLVGLGGDLAMAGSAGESWLVRISETRESLPEVGEDAADAAMIECWDGGVATSTTLARRWRTNRGTVHHVLDPRTGLSAQEYWRTVTVAAESCLQANAAATAALIRGPGAARWLRSLELPARLVRHDGLVVITPGWPSSPDVGAVA